eukprot:SAG31_NODE_2558_length_5489_cov_3.279777_2_plen_90_part_00
MAGQLECAQYEVVVQSTAEAKCINLEKLDRLPTLKKPDVASALNLLIKEAGLEGWTAATTWQYALVSIRLSPPCVPGQISWMWQGFGRS